jgi:3-oxoacyl-[acyl-carrier protein] reductase
MTYSLITGGTKGIGKEICRKLLLKGAGVIAVYNNDETAAIATRNEFESEFPGQFNLIKYDLSDTRNLFQLVSAVGQITESIDILILNAGKTSRRGIADMALEEWESVMAVNVTTSLFLVQKLLPFLSKGANIIFTGSSMAEYPHSVSLSYGVSKAAVHALVKNLVKFLAPLGIRVNCVSPGFTDTEWHKDKSVDARKNITEKISLKRFARPEEIASVYLFIVENQFLNGEIISINGGYSYQ